MQSPTGIWGFDRDGQHRFFPVLALSAVSVDAASLAGAPTYADLTEAATHLKVQSRLVRKSPSA